MSWGRRRENRGGSDMSEGEEGCVQREGKRRHVVCPARELPRGGRRIVDVDGRSIGVFNIDGEYHAVRNICPHQQAPLCEGWLTGTVEANEVLGFGAVQTVKATDCCAACLACFRAWGRPRPYSASSDSITATMASNSKPLLTYTMSPLVPTIQSCG